jgi:hypothetical protein
MEVTRTKYISEFEDCYNLTFYVQKDENILEGIK